METLRSNMNAVRNACALAALAVLLGCGSGPTKTMGITPEGSGLREGSRKWQGKLVLTGSSTMAPLISEIGKRFEKRNPGVRVDVQTGGTARGIVDARSGLADIGMVSRALKKNENDLHGFAVARDGICMVVHKNNSVRELSTAQVASIYTGRVLNWNEFGGADAPITVVNKAAGRSTLDLFLRHFKLAPSKIRAHVVIGDNQQGLKTLAGQPHGIGYVSIGAAEFDARRGVPIKLLSLDGIAASTETVRDGTFPLRRPLTLVSAKRPRGLAKAFIDFARSVEVHELVERHYFVPLEK